MRRAGNKGRGRGVGGRGGVDTGRGRGRSLPAAGPNQIPASRASNRQALTSSFVGPRTNTRLERPEHVDAVINWLAQSASGSLTSSSTQSDVQSAEIALAGHGNLSAISPPAKSARICEPRVMQQSLLLFDDPAGSGSVAHPKSPAPEEEEIVCTDAQPLVLSEEEDVGGPVHMVVRSPQRFSAEVDADDEMHVPFAAAFCSVQANLEGRGEGSVEEEVGDDEFLDPTWIQGPHSDVSGSEEEVEVMRLQQHQHRKRGSRGTKDSRQTVANRTAAVSHRTNVLPTLKPASKTSKAWNFFKESPHDRTQVVCLLCHQCLKRGINVLNLNTSCMTRHLMAKHSLQWSKHLQTLAKPDPPPASSSAVVRASSTHSLAAVPAAYSQSEEVTPALPPPSTLPPSPSHSTLSHGSIQLSIPQILERKRKYPPTHHRAQALNTSICKLLALEMLPFRLVERDAFKDLMALTVPQYVIPSRHYFSRRAIPALHQHVADNITCALRNAISTKVHITTDTWTSKHGQGRYISLTAHWVNVVAAGHEKDGTVAHLLPPPRIAGNTPVRVAASSSSFSGSSTPSSFELSQRVPSPTSVEHHACTTNFSTARGKRQQAVFKMICLGDKSHTAMELWTGIKEQTDQWLLPLNLQPGMVVCDNGRNLIAALGLAGLTHIPCLAHVLNLVVQSFLKNYPLLSELLQKVRNLCAHFRRSSTAAARLSVLQRNLNLPTHRLICDVPTRWNSTLHMLERLCEQQQAIMEYQLQHARVSRSVQLPNFIPTEWACMRDICAVLRCFEDSTKMASADDAIISLTIPLVCLLEKTLQGMLDEMVAPEEEEGQGTMPCFSGQSSSQGSENVFLYHQQPWTQLSSQGTLFEEEEDEEEELRAQQGGVYSSPRASVERGWMDSDEPESTPPTEDSGSLVEGSLAHMSEFMLQCLRNDRRIARIANSADYWVATLLDPRYKDNVPSLLPSLERDRKMREYQRTLVDALVTAFPPDSRDARPLHRGSVDARGGGGGSRQRGWSSSSTEEGRARLAKMWDTFLSAPQRSAEPSDAAPVTRRQLFKNMVGEYMSTRVSVVRHSSATFNFWVSKLDVWPELALYALEVLACPAASVLSERVFSTAGGVITDNRIRLSTDNVDKLTSIKMNHTWIRQDFSIPGAD